MTTFRCIYLIIGEFMVSLFKTRYTKETEVGKIYGHLEVLEFKHHYSDGGKKIRARAIVRCLNCNSKPYEIGHQSLVSLVRPIKSCGCVNPGRTSHGLRHHPYYNSCCSAIGRCKPNHFQHEYYYDRGIKCYWTMENIDEFIRYLEENLPERQDGETLDRIDNDRGYEPGNVRWASKSEQSRNQRRHIRNHEFDQLKKENEQLRKENERLVAEVKSLRQLLEIT